MLGDVLMIMERIQEAKAGFRSLTKATDTTTAPGHIRTHLISLLQWRRCVVDSGAGPDYFNRPYWNQRTGHSSQQKEGQ